MDVSRKDERSMREGEGRRKPKRYERVSSLNDILSSDALFLHNSTSGRANENVERIEGRVGQGRKGKKKKKKELRERGARDIPFLEGGELRLEMSTPNGSYTSLLEWSAYLDAKHMVY